MSKLQQPFVTFEYKEDTSISCIGKGNSGYGAILGTLKMKLNQTNKGSILLYRFYPSVKRISKEVVSISIAQLKSITAEGERLNLLQFKKFQRWSCDDRP